MCGYTRKIKSLCNDHIIGQVSVASIEKKIVYNHLRWFVHMRRRPSKAQVRRAEQIIFSPKGRGKGRPRRTLK